MTSFISGNDMKIAQSANCWAFCSGSRDHISVVTTSGVDTLVRFVPGDKMLLQQQHPSIGESVSFISSSSTRVGHGDDGGRLIKRSAPMQPKLGRIRLTMRELGAREV